MRTRHKDGPHEVEAREARHSGARLAERVVSEYGTRNVLEIANRAGVSIFYERWPLVTAGECEPRKASVCVNLNALDQAQGTMGSLCYVRDMVVAHELGHLFHWKAGGPSGDQESTGFLAEEVAHGFAEEMLQLPFSIQECEKIWQTR